MKSTHNILVTRELTDEQISLAESLGLKVFVEPAIEIHFRNDWLTVQIAIEKAEKPVFVFTSRNGAISFLRFLKAGVKVSENPFIYAVGKKTAEILQEAGFDPVIPDSHYGAKLAEKIIGDLGEEEKNEFTILHFCGDKRREELRQVLSQSGLKVKDIVVYQTRLKQISTPDNSTDGILFYSPSAVQSFRNSGGFERPDLPELFAIGTTTAEELSIASGKHVHISPETATEPFLKFVSQVLNSLKS